jgi:L-cysteate sulfo-lyase
MGILLYSLEKKKIKNMNEVDLTKFRKANLSILPTPFTYLENFSKKFGAKVFCKRDDLTGFAFGGNKTRKLDYIIADALNKKANTLVGIGAVQSNFCRIAAGAGAVYGLDVHLVLGGKEPKKATANLLIDNMFGANVHFVESADWSLWEEYGEKLVSELEKEGKKVYFMPIGGSSPIGALGYVNAFYEILRDFDNMNLKFDYIVHSSTSAGTQAGLIVGKQLTGWEGKIIGIGSAKSRKQLTDEVYSLVKETGKLFDVNFKIAYEDVIIDDSYIGKEYGDITEKGTEAIDYFAKLEGIFLDSVYSGKAASGLIDYILNKKFGKDKNILFIHTGGNIHLFK